MKNVDLCKKQNQSLNLSCSSLKYIPIDKKYERIVKLDISHNHLQTLENIEQFKMLTDLTMSHNRIASWNQLLRIKNKDRLRTLNVRNNLLELEPNYKYRIIRQFSRLEKIDEIELPRDYARTIVQIQRVVEEKVIEWMARMISIDKLLEEYEKETISAQKGVISTRQSTMAPTRVQTTRNCPINILQLRQLLQSLTFEPDSSSHPLLQNCLQIVNILSHQIPIQIDPSILEAVEVSFFRQLLIEISSRTNSFMSYLLNQIETQYDISEEILKNNTQLSTKIIWSEFKRLYGRDVGKSTQISSIQTQDIIRPIFPFLVCEQYYVESLLKMMQDMFVETKQRITNILNRENTYINISQNYKKQIEYPQYLSKQSEDEDSLEISEKSMDEMPDQQPKQQVQQESQRLEQSEQQQSEIKKNIPTPLAITVINIFNSYCLKNAFKHILFASKHQILRNLYLLLGVKSTISLRFGFQALKAIHIYHESLQHYYQLSIYRRIFRTLLHLVERKRLRLLKLRRIINRKQRIHNTLKHFAFSRWKMMNSKTLKYISSIKNTKGMSRKEISAQYDKLKRTGY